MSGGGFRACPAECRAQRSRRRPCLEPVVDGRGRAAAFCATEHLRHLLAPLLGAFQTSYPNVRVEVLVTNRFVDLIADGIDLVFRLGALRDSSLVARKILTYRHQLVASPPYLEMAKIPRPPRDLFAHNLPAFSHWRASNSSTFLLQTA